MAPVAQAFAEFVTGIPVTNCANACATGATAFRGAWMAIKAGVCDTVLAVGVEQLGRAGLLGGGGGGGGIPKEGLLGSGLMPAVFAEAGMEHTRKYGTSFEQFAQVSVKNHQHSTRDAKSMYRKETPLEMVMGAEMIAYPNTKLMCSVNVDGAAAARSTLTEHISLVFGYAIISEFITTSRGVSFWYMDFGFLTEC